MDKKYDVIISGAGPSGSLLGYLLSLNNIQTLILEKKFFPRYKICGGGIQHRTRNLLPYDIGKVIENTIYGIYFSKKNENIILKKHDLPIMYTVDRGNFDWFLSREAKKKGCTIFLAKKLKILK
jgi:flavin-dependent dehydrogenase